MDQLAALRWVRQNISAFGGDADNVTIMGENAGGISVVQWLTSPLGKGLFHRAIIMSGGDGEFLQGRSGLAAAEQAGVTFAMTKGIGADDPQALTKMRALSADAVTDGLNMSTMRNIREPSFSSPFDDGKLSVRPVPALRSGAFARVPVMIGATSADLGGPTGPMIAGARQLTELISAHDVPVYYYRFAYEHTVEGATPSGARHASDVPFFLANAAIRYGDMTTQKDQAMSDVIGRYVANFVRTANPPAQGLPSWTAFSSGDRHMMKFTADGTAVQKKDDLEVPLPLSQ